jgi:hypothetical protein
VRPLRLVLPSIQLADETGKIFPMNIFDQMAVEMFNQKPACGQL